MSDFELLITHDAERDFEMIFNSVWKKEGWQSARDVAELLIDLSDGGEVEPGSPFDPAPRELSTVGIFAYRQVLLDPWRVIYRKSEGRVIIYLVAEIRGDMQLILANRLFRA